MTFPFEAIAYLTFFDCLYLLSIILMNNHTVVGLQSLCCCWYLFLPVLSQMHMMSILQNKTEMFSFLIKVSEQKFMSVQN